MAKKLSKLEIISRLKKIDWIEFDENEIVNYRTYFTVKCKKCGNVYLTTPANLFLGNKCKNCKISKLKDKANVLEFLKKRYSDSIDFTKSKYKNIRTPILCKCKLCGEEFNITPLYYNRDTKIKFPCPHCRKERERLEYLKEVLNRIEQKFPNKFDCSKVYVINAKTKIILICKNCNTEFLITPDSLLNSKDCFIGCPNCAEKSRVEKRTKTTEEFIKEARELYGDLYDYSKSIYKGYRKPIKIICRKHGPFITLPHYHLAKYGGTCPKCSCSSGELLVMNILEKLKISYIYLFLIKSNKFSNDKKYVLMDFLISKDSHIMFIEFNGEQHYKPVKLFGGEEAFKKQLKRDLEVKEYCKENNYPLLIIPYNCSNKNIEKLIKLFYGICLSETSNN